MIVGKMHKWPWDLQRFYMQFPHTIWPRKYWATIRFGKNREYESVRHLANKAAPTLGTPSIPLLIHYFFESLLWKLRGSSKTESLQTKLLEVCDKRQSLIVGTLICGQKKLTVTSACFCCCCRCLRCSYTAVARFFFISFWLTYLFPLMVQRASIL